MMNSSTQPGELLAAGIDYSQLGFVAQFLCRGLPLAWISATECWCELQYDL